MATLREYFDKDGSRTLCIHNTFTISSENGEPLLDVIGRVHLDFESNGKYVSFYIPSTDKVYCPARMALTSLDKVLNFTQGILIEGGYSYDEKMTASDMDFTGRIFIYSEDDMSEENISYIRQQSEKLGHNVKFRFNTYATERSNLEKPLAFISHDSRDKDDIARPLAIALQKQMCPVWFDEFTL